MHILPFYAFLTQHSLASGEIINSSLQMTCRFPTLYDKGIFLDGWIAAGLQSVPKNGFKTITLNYRSILLLPVSGKSTHSRSFAMKDPLVTLPSFINYSWNKFFELIWHSESIWRMWHASLPHKLRTAVFAVNYVLGHQLSLSQTNFGCRKCACNLIPSEH